MRATILLTAMLIAASSHAESPADASSSPATAAAACPCAETSTINLGAAPEPESVVTIAPASSTASSATGFGSSARSWVDLQAGGSAASVTARPLPGDAATNAYERYANSFKHPIPESFKRESFSADGSSK
ncbi:MAG: hypothetical protein C0434_00165 [Xanthomonadaceae bacterium]|nr:hypothetical protein [Xanthomonadaceae bacterium]